MSGELPELILQLARVPSFSSFEERLHPLVLAQVERMPGAEVELVRQRNMVVRVPGRAGAEPVALTAHLDKINHFDQDLERPLPAEQIGGKLRGIMDDAAGVGICLHLGQLAASHRGRFPPLLLLLSELEEGTGLREHPHLLRDGGQGLRHGMGAERMARHLIALDAVPGLVITVDTTPQFRGPAGIALYHRHWERTRLDPSQALRAETQAQVDRLLDLEPDLALLEGNNDYQTYGRVLNMESGSSRPVVSLALEPAIWPYHAADEEVHVADVLRLTALLERYLSC